MNHVHKYREPRETRNKRIAIEAIALLRRMVNVLNRARQGVMLDVDAGDELEEFTRRWEKRDVPWVRPGGPAYDPDTWLTANEMALYMDTTAAAVRRWAYRGHVTVLDGAESPLYNVGECMAYRAKKGPQNASEGLLVSR